MSLSQYIIGDIINDDIYSTTYKAKNEIDNSNIVLKKIKNGSISHRVQKIVESEIEKLKKLSHINIPQITGYFHNEVDTYIVFNDYTNYTLRHHIHKMTCGNIISLFIQLVNIIDYIHELNIVYYNLKPENIILDENVKLINFGSTILCNGVCPKNRVIEYAYTGSAPEILKNIKILKQNEYLLDIWSFGVIMFETIFGIIILESSEKSIIDGSWNIDTMIIECLEKIPRSRNLWTSIPEKIKNIIIRCLSLIPEERPSINVFINDIINDSTIQSLVNNNFTCNSIVSEKDIYASIEREEHIKMERDKNLKIEMEYQEELKKIEKLKKNIENENRLLEIKKQEFLKQKQEQSDQEICLNILKHDNEINTKKIKKQSAELEMKSREMDEIIQKKSSELEEIIQKHKITRNIFPPEWTDVHYFNTFDHSKPGFVLIDIAPSSMEYSKIFDIMNSNPYKRSNFSRTKNEFNKNIVKIERVQNPMAWVSYYYTILMLSGRSGLNNDDIFNNANEYIMKHGTRDTDPLKIAESQYGIDSRYSEAGFYGFAAYVAEDALYSDGYRYNKSHNLAQMFIVRVAAGKIFDAENIFKNNKEKYRNTIHPPTGYDSVRGYVTPNNKAIMTYKPDSVYPEYLITYEK